MLLGMFGFFSFVFVFLGVFFVCNRYCWESILTQQALHQYKISWIVVPQWQSTHWWHYFKVNLKDQGHVIVKVGCERNTYFLNGCNQINSKLGVKVAYGLLLSWLIFGAEPRWPSWVSLRVGIFLPQGRIVPYCTMSGSTSCEYPWWVLSKSIKILTLWRHLVTSWSKTEFPPKIQLFVFHLRNIIVSKQAYQGVSNHLTK
jgi:hypothetical protein